MNLLTRLMNHMRAHRTQRHTGRTTPGVSSAVVTLAVNDTRQALPQTAASSTVSGTGPMLQAPTGLQQTALRVQSNADRTSQVPPYANPSLTYASLEAWQNADGQTDIEKKERGRLAQAILKMAALSATEGSRFGNLEINGDLRLYHYPNLTQLPAGLHLSGDLDCRGCTSLTQLPEGLSVGGDLNCSRCPNLTQLPEGLSIGGGFDCHNCPGLTYLPENLSIGGDFDCHNCPGLTYL
ncbi:MAG: hypothetical protein EOO38_31415, partial [Cytophagaceae bacterium]